MKIDTATNQVVIELQVRSPLRVVFAEGYISSIDFDNSRLLRFDEKP
jgi:hypothetical protein